MNLTFLNYFLIFPYVLYKFAVMLTMFITLITNRGGVCKYL